jgi:glycosyltransferase involved in cell wall biosynthesis
MQETHAVFSDLAVQSGIAVPETPGGFWESGYVRAVRRLLGDEVCGRLGIYELPPGFRLSVVVPVYNEVSTIDQVVARTLATGLPLEILLVDDGSHDGTRERLEALGRQHAEVRAIFHARNQGKGAAIRTGFAQASGQVIVVQDADLEYDPQDFRYLLQPIIAGDADVVFGTRYGHCDRIVSPTWHQAVNGLITTLNNWAIGLRLSDVETCYKMVRSELLKKILPTLKEQRFGIEIELTARLAQQKARFAERPIRYQHRWYDDGKKIGWRDGVAALWCIAKYSAWERIFGGPVSEPRYPPKDDRARV